jgi:hypothetical protein
MTAPERAGGRWWNIGSHFTWAASLFLAGLGAKFGLILAYGFSLPYHDQWPAEAFELFIPCLSGKFSLAVLFEPHNEHWIIFTRILELSLLQLNGQWDSVLEMACNAAIHCAGAAGFGWLMASLLGKRSWLLIWPVLALDLALPFAWENTLWGFQSQFYFLQIFSWLTIWLLGTNQSWSARWWLGAAIALADVFTMAPGFLAAAAVVALTGMAALKQGEWRRHLPTWGFCLLIIVLGIVLKYSLAVDSVDQVHSIGDLLQSLGKSLAWPWVTFPWYALFNLFPLWLLARMWFRSKEPMKPGERMIFGVGIWACLQGLAGAFARGNGGVGPVWRYMDSLSFLGISGALAGWVLLKDYRARIKFAPMLYAALACWALGCLSGMGVLTKEAWTEAIPDTVAERQAQLKASRAWLATGDPAVFLAQPEDKRIAPFAAWLMARPQIRGVLPASVRDTLPIVPVTNNGDAFVRNGWRLNEPDAPTEKSWGSWSAQKAAARGTFESRPVRKSALPYLEIPVAGDLGAEGLSLELVELNGGKATEVRPKTVPGGKWVNVHVKTPAGEFKVVARDESDTKWFAFKEPRELGRWSYWTLKLLACWKCFVVIGLGGFLVNLACLIRKPDAGIKER